MLLELDVVEGPVRARCDDDLRLGGGVHQDEGDSRRLVDDLEVELDARVPQPEERYFGVVERKTATLFEAGTRIAAVLAGASPELEERCARYGASLGRAFQITDDVLDYSGHAEDIGKRLGDDLREGKVTLPLIHALRSAVPEQRELVARAVREG